VDDWGKLLGGSDAVTAMLDRLLHHGPRRDDRVWQVMRSRSSRFLILLLLLDFGSFRSFPAAVRLNSTALTKHSISLRLRIFALRKIVEKQIERSNATVPGDDKIGSRVGWWFAGNARYPSNPSGINEFLGREEGLICEIWVCCFYHTSNTINLVSATKYTAFGVIECCIFMKDLVDCSATTHGSFSPNTSLRLRSSKVDMLLDIVFSVSDCRLQAIRVQQGSTDNPRPH